MSEIKMLPLPGCFSGFGAKVWQAVRNYARAVAEHNVAARDAEIESLRAEVSGLRAARRPAAGRPQE